MWALSHGKVHQQEHQPTLEKLDDMEDLCQLAKDQDSGNIFGVE